MRRRQTKEQLWAELDALDIGEREVSFKLWYGLWGERRAWIREWLEIKQRSRDPNEVAGRTRSAQVSFDAAHWVQGTFFAVAFLVGITVVIVRFLG